MTLLAAIALLLCFGTGFWLLALILCSFTWVQRQVFYAHNAPITRGQQLNKPETFGYLKNQAIAQTIATPDGVSLYSWLVVPLRVYLKNESPLAGASSVEDAKDVAIRCIASDSQARLVIYFHGNAGTVGQTRRTEAYRSITTGDPDHVYVLAYDYRGFGRSTGTPTEPGLVKDALAVIDWVLTVAKVPPKQIFFVSQSLGTAIACAAVNHHASKNPPVEFGGIMMCAPFTNAAEVFMSYSVFGRLPLLAPLRYIPWLRNYFIRVITDTWDTSSRLQSIIAKTTTLKLTLVHATSDKVIPCRMTEALSEMITDCLKDHGVDAEEKNDVGEGGTATEWRAGSRVVRKVILRHGGR